MAAIVVIEERNGVTPGTPTLSISTLNMGSDDSANIVPATYPITAQADGHAFEKWIRLQLSDLDTSSIVDNFKIWLSSIGAGWATGEGMSTNARTAGYTAETYPAGGPVDTDSAVADQVMPETEPVGPNLGIAGSLAGQLTAPGYSDFLIIQHDVSELTPAGSLTQKVFTFQYDEQ